MCTISAMAWGEGYFDTSANGYYRPFAIQFSACGRSMFTFDGQNHQPKQAHLNSQAIGPTNKSMVFLFTASPKLRQLSANNVLTLEKCQHKIDYKH